MKSRKAYSPREVVEMMKIWGIVETAYAAVIRDAGTSRDGFNIDKLSDAVRNYRESAPENIQKETEGVIRSLEEGLSRRSKE